jgi:glycosyltransferase involved in cell wall biosynthesis
MTRNVRAPFTLGVLCDLLEERWFSMDLVGDMLLERAAGMPDVRAERVRPRLPAPLARYAEAHGRSPFARWAYRASIGFGRYVEYPLQAWGARGRYDFFHIADHSYGHLALGLPAGRVGIYCHDLDAYRPVFEPERHGVASRALAGMLLRGLERAAVVFHSTLTVREQVLERGLVAPERLVHAPYGVGAEFQPEPRAEDAELAGRPPFVMHVGSLIPRKNPDFLLKLLLALGRAEPDLEFYKVGGAFTDAQRAELSAGGVLGRVREVRHLTRLELAAHLRATRALLLPSLAEGFGLPVIEALACGAPVVVSDIPVLREVGAAGVVVRKTDSVDAWCETVRAMARGEGPDRAQRLRVAAGYTWEGHARVVVGAYSGLAARGSRV